MTNTEILRKKLNELERLAQEAMRFTNKVAEDFRAKGYSMRRQHAVEARRAGRSEDDPYSAMWNAVKEAHDFAEANGFPEVAEQIVMGVVGDAAPARMLQRAADSFQARGKEGEERKDAQRESMANSFKAQAEVCMDKILEARRARAALDKGAR